MLAVDIRIGIDANLIAEFTAEHLPDRDPVCFSGEVPKRDLDSGDAAALVGVPAELLDPAEQLVNVAGVFTDQKALEHDRPDAAAAFADLAVAFEALVGQDFENSRAVRTADVADFEIRDFQIRRIG